MNPGEDRPQGSASPRPTPNVADESTNTVAIGARPVAVAEPSVELSSMGTVISAAPGQQGASTAAVPRQPAAPAQPEPPARRDADFEDASPKQLDLTGRTIGGYKVTRMLGAGGMGAVCLAHQVSLDRDVALKILPAKLAKNPDFLMRFMREGLSAARMTHHNIIQIYDIGDADNIHYISLEYVRGQTLGQILRDQRRLDANTAAGYILQAARGLEYAHRRGIIHRDIKPDNLMLNEHGIVKIADMGLAKMLNEAKRGGSAPAPAPAQGIPELAEALKTATGDLTMGDIAMGTPSYMPPEQARDASSVDHRADQYSLGCTFYALLVGHAPFTGGSAYELIHKHLIDPPPPLEELAPETPIDVIRIIYKMLAKEPDDRFPDMTAVITELENFMGGHGQRIPNQGHFRTLEQALADYYAPAATRRRKLAMIVFGAGVPTLALTLYWMVFLFKPEQNASVFISWAIGVLGLTPVCKFLHEGFREKTYFFRRFKNFVLTMSFMEWAAAAFACLIAMFIVGGPVIFLISLICSAGLAVAYDLLVKSRIRWQHSRPIEEMNRMMKELRIGGLGENAIEGFVAGYSGDNWEEFYEALFGYEAMIQARERLLETAKGKPRKMAAAWRDPLVRLLDKAEAARKARREKKQLSKIEAQRLQSAGVTRAEAKKKADEMASMLVNKANIQAEQQLIYVPASSLHIEKAGQTKRDQALLPAPRPAQATPLAGARTKQRPRIGFDQAARFFLGLGLCIGFGLPAGMKAMLPDLIFKWSQGTWALALIAGVMMMISTFSSRKTWGMILLAGGALFTLHVPLREFVPDNYDPLGISLIMIAAGFVIPWLSKLTGKEY